MTSLKQVAGSNIFCGPAIISSVAGITTDEAAQRIQKLRKNNAPVRGVWSWELEAIFTQLGFNSVPISKLERGTLFNALCSLPEPGIYVIVVPGHFVCIELDSDRKRWFIDNHTKKPMNAAAAARGMQQVTWIRRVIKR